jgi:NitT/TauT family transport system ATP-binding protein
MPPPALLPISIVLLNDIGNKQKVAFISFFCMFPVLLNTIEGVRSIDPTLVDTMRSYRIPRRERIRRIVLPGALPQIVAGMRTSLALAVIMMVLAEYFSSTNGVGYVLLISKNTFELAPMWAAILLIGLLGYLLNLLFLLVERRGHRIDWRGRAPGQGAPAAHAGDQVPEQDLRKRREGDSCNRGRLVCGRGPGVRLCRRAVRLWEDDAAEGHRRVAAADRRRGAAARSPCDRPARGDGAGLPGVRTLVDAWTSVRNNVLLPLRHKKLERSERSRLVEDSLVAVGLDGFGDHFPWQLSGGMQQRVAIARALAYQPSILLMDEPFASVDAQTRGDLEDLVLQVREEFGVTIVVVTHDIDESVYLSDRIVVLTNAPTVVKEVVGVELPSPRDQLETKELPEFAHLRTHVYRLIKRDQRAPQGADAPPTLVGEGLIDQGRR